MQCAGNILRQFIKDYGLESALTLQTIKKQWVSLVGDIIASHTSPDSIKGKTIFITVDTPQWMHHLSFYKQEISEKLKPYKLEVVRFSIGRLNKNLGNEPKATDVSQLDDDDSKYIENTIKSLKDNNLKEKFRELLTHGLRHEKK